MKINSEIGVYNLALNAVGERANISSPTENSRRAEVCQLWYHLVRDQVLEAAPWPEATQTRRLALSAVAEGEWAVGHPMPGYSHVFALPADCLRPQHLEDFLPFELSTENEVKLLHCNTSRPILRYTYVQENVALWSNNLLMAIVYGLAAHISQPLTGKTSLTNALIERANDMILAARVSSANLPQQQFNVLPDWITGRGYRHESRNQFFYPSGSLLYVS